MDVMGMMVYGEPDAVALGAFVPKVEELNLSHNLISRWEDVGEVIKHLDNLNFLHLRYSMLSILDLPTPVAKMCVKILTALLGLVDYPETYTL